MKPKKITWKNATEEERKFLFFDNGEQAYEHISICMACKRKFGTDKVNEDLCNYLDCKRLRNGTKKE